jgi:hypothetical protein
MKPARAARVECAAFPGALQVRNVVVLTLVSQGTLGFAGADSGCDAT